MVDGTPTYYSYNAANQLTETTEGETTYYHYDGRGNTVAKQEAAGTTYYRYNTENLMTRIDFAAGGSSYYEYDADSKRVSQRTPDGYRAFVYQGPDMLKLQLERDESEETVAHYTMGSGLEAMRRDSASSFYHYNHLGTALALTGADEAVSDTYRHDAWGVLLERTGSTVNPHTYVGRECYYRMPNAAMYQLGFRDYAQGVGRFTTVDPVRNGHNWRSYAAHPTILIDPTGLIWPRPDPVGTSTDLADCLTRVEEWFDAEKRDVKVWYDTFQLVCAMLSARCGGACRVDTKAMYNRLMEPLKQLYLIRRRLCLLKWTPPGGDVIFWPDPGEWPEVPVYHYICVDTDDLGGHPLPPPEEVSPGIIVHFVPCDDGEPINAPSQILQGDSSRKPRS